MSYATLVTTEQHYERGNKCVLWADLSEGVAVTFISFYADNYIVEACWSRVLLKCSLVASVQESQTVSFSK